MNNKKNVSSLSAHKLKKGIIVTPANDALGKLLTLTSWGKERMPEYLWLGLILQHYGRKEGFAKCFQILHELSVSVMSLSNPQLSIILSLPEQEQRKIYEIIDKVVDKSIISPLTVIFRKRVYPIFNEYFFLPQLSVESRISTLQNAIKIFSPSQSHESTDLAFLASILMLFQGRLHVPQEIGNILQEYPNTEHADERMEMYRPHIRCMEGSIAAMGMAKNSGFMVKFWRDIGMLTPCKPWGIKCDNNPVVLDGFINDCRKILEYVLSTNKERSLSEDKFHIISGSINYALKIFAEIDNKSLGNSILGRHGIRTIIEIYIMLKYLLKNETEKPDIWKEYKAYGIGKYKLVLLKARETELEKTSHFIPPIADAIVNEHMFEEYTDIDLRYFDKLGIRDKSKEVGEKELYDLFYDYDSSFSHGLWGAIRESAMLPCDNACHQYHCIPDIYANQSLPDVKSDCVKIMKQLFFLLATVYEIPDNFVAWIKK